MNAVTYRHSKIASLMAFLSFSEFKGFTWEYQLCYNNTEITNIVVLAVSQRPASPTFRLSSQVARLSSVAGAVVTAWRQRWKFVGQHQDPFQSTGQVLLSLRYRSHFSEHVYWLRRTVVQLYKLKKVNIYRHIYICTFIIIMYRYVTLIPYIYILPRAS